MNLTTEAGKCYLTLTLLSRTTWLFPWRLDITEFHCILFLCVSRPQSSSNGSDTCSTNHSVCAGSGSLLLNQADAAPSYETSCSWRESFGWKECTWKRADDRDEGVIGVGNLTLLRTS